MPRSISGHEKIDKEKLQKALLSIGTDKDAVARLISSKSLGRAVIPIYWKDGIVKKTSSFYLPG